MITLPHYASLPVGAMITLVGRSYTHRGAGVFEPSDDGSLMKRFDQDEGLTLHRAAA
jgi:hypothetical protein